MWFSAEAYRAETESQQIEFLRDEKDVESILKALRIEQISDVRITDSKFSSFDPQSTVEVMMMACYVGGTMDVIILSEGENVMKVCRLTGPDGTPQFVGFIDNKSSDNKRQNVIFLASDTGSSLLDQV